MNLRQIWKQRRASVAGAFLGVMMGIIFLLITVQIIVNNSGTNKVFTGLTEQVGTYFGPVGIVILLAMLAAKLDINL